MDKCNYINHHTFKLNTIEKATYDYFKYQYTPCICIKCGHSNKVIYVIKNTQSKTMKRISNVTGIIKANPHGYKMNGYTASSRYYCKRCELFF